MSPTGMLNKIQFSFWTTCVFIIDNIEIIGSIILRIVSMKPLKESDNCVTE